MPIALLPPLTRSGARWSLDHIHQEALTEGPGYARTSGMSRWHRVRSGKVFVFEDQRSTSFQLWCGQFARPESAMVCDAPEDGVPVCGTCDGRAEGFNPERPELLFTPATLTPPRWCPSQLWATVGPNVGRCLACGRIVQVKGRARGYDYTVKLAKHEPLELVAGCPFHAWHCLVAVDGTARCACQVPNPNAGKAETR